MKMKCFNVLLCIALGSVFCGCQHRHYRDEKVETETSTASTEDDSYKDERRIRRGTKVRMEAAGGVYLVPINVNGLDLKFIFDTGASCICISSAEATVMVRQGKITKEDILGQQQFLDATGGVSVGTVINLRTVEIGGIVLHDVKANVVDNIQAPLLLGQTALAKFGKISIDYDDLTIEFN